MKQKKTFITILLIVALLCLGIAYAAIADVDLTISGNVAATAAEGKIDVQFTNATVTSNPNNATAVANVTSDKTKATINVSGLKTEGQTVTVTYTIENKATDIAATLEQPTVTFDNTEWFEVQCTLSGTTLEKHSDATTDTQTATVVVKLKKTPVTTEDQTSAQDEITITIKACPVANGAEN